MIAVCISTHNRYNVFKPTYRNIKKYLPKDAILIVVDDASKVPVPEATYRFDENVGIARSKNKCLELAEAAGATDIFLFDDDCYPLSNGWEKPYIESPEPHLMYIFKDFATRPLGDSKLIYEDSKLKAYSHPRGCMIYAHVSVLAVAGGMDSSYGRWGYDHVDWSNRIFNKGLTSFRFADVAESKGLFYSADEHEAVQGSVPAIEKSKYIREMRGKFQASFTSTEFCEYRTEPKQGNNIVLAAYFNSQPDPQRGTRWEAKFSEVEALAKSVQGHDQKLVLLHDCFDDHYPLKTEMVRVETTMPTPYFQRWFEYYKYLRDHPDIDNVFIVDSTDVEMINNPFPYMRTGKIYIGDEPLKLGTQWMLRYREPTIMNFIRRNRTAQLLNCGVVGGSRADIMALCHDIFAMYFDTNGAVGDTEMGVFNYLCYNKYRPQIEHGRHVTNVFKSYKKEGGWWFAHK